MINYNVSGMLGMAHVQRPTSIVALTIISLLSMLVGLVHISDAIVRGELGDPALENIDATINSVYAVVYLFGIALSWTQSRVGYFIVLVVSALSAYGSFGHTTGATSPNLTELGKISGVFFVFVVLIGAVTSTSAVLLSIYVLVKGRLSATKAR